MGHAEIHDRQHHEDERLQGDYQDVENRPADLHQPRGNHPGNAGAEKRGDEDKDHFAGVHVAEQSQPEREGLGQQADDGPGLFGEAPAKTSLDVNPEHPVARHIAALSDPGTLLIRRAWDQDRKKLKAQITVDEVRKLKAQLERRFQVSITDDALRKAIRLMNSRAPGFALCAVPWQGRAR